MIPCATILEAIRAAGVLSTEPDCRDLHISGIADDSRTVTPGALFCALVGSGADGHTYVADAIARGAIAALVSRPVPDDIPQIVVTDDRQATSAAAAAFFEGQSTGVDLLGVTGTNGKSTTVSLIQHILGAAGDVGVVGTLGAMDGRGVAVYREGLTTPGIVELHRTLATLRARGVRRVAMEVSSHALDQRRVVGLEFCSATFTNLTHDHLDYHGSMGEYLRAKERLVEHSRDDAVIVTNADDPSWDGLSVGGRQRLTYGVLSKADVRAQSIEFRPQATSFEVAVDGRMYGLALPLIGDFNVSNALAAIATAWGLGESVETVLARLAHAPQVAGRMERLRTDGKVVLRDYAHTPDALDRALRAARTVTQKRLIVLFGCGGDRDKKKRAPMGRIAAKLADVVIATSDNPRTEDPVAILDDIAEGMDGVAYLRVTDRMEAIQRALAMLEEGDCLLLAGKGHETYQVIGRERRPFDEREIVEDTFAQMTQ